MTIIMVVIFIISIYEDIMINWRARGTVIRAAVTPRNNSSSNTKSNRQLSVSIPALLQLPAASLSWHSTHRGSGISQFKTERSLNVYPEQVE